MDRLFGKKKPTEPVVEVPKVAAPTLGETSEKVSFNTCQLTLLYVQLDLRTKAIQVKVDEQNAELGKIKTQMAGAKGQRLNTLKQKALMIIRKRKMYDSQLN